MGESGGWAPKRRIRLPRAAYDGPGLVAMITIGIRDRRRVFLDPLFTRSCIAELRRTCIEQHVAVFAYCFMPDHVHAVLEIEGDGNLIDIVRLFKGRTSRQAGDHGFRRSFWQESFYDHIARPDEQPDKYIRYVLENPVRAGLVDYIDDYPYVGSFEYQADSNEELLW